MTGRVFDDQYTEPYPELAPPPVRSCCASWMDGNHADDCTSAVAVRDIDLASDPEAWQDELPDNVGEPVDHDIDGEELGGDQHRDD